MKSLLLKAIKTVPMGPLANSSTTKFGDSSAAVLSFLLPLLLVTYQVAQRGSHSSVGAGLRLVDRAHVDVTFLGNGARDFNIGTWRACPMCLQCFHSGWALPDMNSPFRASLYVNHSEDIKPQRHSDVPPMHTIPTLK